MSAPALRVTRTFAAARERVFRAWTDPEELVRWWGPPGWTTPRADIDLRAGGSYRLTMRSPDGVFKFVSGTYREVEVPARLVYTWQVDDGEITLVTVEFIARGATTEVVIVHDGFGSDGTRADHERGWNGCFRRLGEALSS
jgi:uncharacterized protein YndB with AHSA1/START domain